MKKFFKKLAGYLVTIYANRTFRKAIKEADAVHEQLKERIYVVSSLTDISQLIILNREKFRLMKRALNLKDHNIDKLAEGAWYYTPDRSGKGGLTERQLEVRRLSFVRHMLVRAKLK